jgi:hypothetical protein
MPGNRHWNFWSVILLEARALVPQIHFRQGPWNADLRTPRGPEGSNGSLLCVCRGHPGTFEFTILDLRLTIGSRA